MAGTASLFTGWASVHRPHEQYENVVLATGHGMMGLSLGPATGKLVSDVIDEVPIGLDMQAFGPDRFN